MRNYLLTIILFIFSIPALHAQHKKPHFFKDNGTSVKNKDSADYYRTIDNPAAENEYYTISEYFMNDQLKSKGYSLTTDPVKYERDYVSYFKNGHKHSEISYTKGLQDSVTNYYPNGNLYRHLIIKNIPSIPPLIYIETVKDSTGKEMVVKGNGKAVFYGKNFKEITDSGNVRNGLQDSVWTGIYDKDIKYKEVFEHGHLTSGTSTDNKNVTFTYKQRLIQPAYQGGIHELYAYISRKTKYPPKAVELGTQGTVHLKFAVEKDGRITEVKVMNSVDPDLSEEAIRVLLSVRSMEPGLYRGRPSKMYFNLPVSFNLNR